MVGNGGFPCNGLKFSLTSRNSFFILKKRDTLNEMKAFQKDFIPLNPIPLNFSPIPFPEIDSSTFKKFYKIGGKR